MEEKFDVLKALKETFQTVFGNTEGVRYYFAPGRVNLIGEHTDYNGGHVFPCALTVGTYGAARLREDKQIRLYSLNRAMNGISFSSVEDLRPLTGEQSWTNYIRGVVWSMQNRNYEFDTGFEMVIYGDIPAGAGLSSSASLEVLTGCKLEASLAGAQAPADYQFLRLGYFCVDSVDSTPEHPVFNRSVALKESFKK